MRNIEKAVEQYKEKYFTKENSRNRGGFWLSDFQQIKELAERRNGGKPELFTAIDISLMAGYMIGYRTAKREDRERRKKK